MPLKGDYFKRDFARSARLLWRAAQAAAGLSHSRRSRASRAFYWLTDRDPALAQAPCQGASITPGFGDGPRHPSVDVVAEVAAPLGIKADELKAALNDAAVKDRLRKEVDDAIAREIFGSPYIIVDGEPFWGADRLPHVDKWLATGGW